MKKLYGSLLILLWLMVGCRAQPVSEPFRYVNFRVYDPVYVALDKGFCAERGLDLQIVGDVLAGPNAIQAVAGGSAEAGLSSVPALINANAAGLPVQGVVDIQTTLAGQSLQNWYVWQDSPLQVLEDVTKGQYTFAVNIWNSSFHNTALLAFDQRGIPEDAVTWQLLSFSDQITALEQGQVDIIGLIEPYQTYLENTHGGQVRQLFNDYDDVYGERHVSLIFINRIYAQHQPEQARAFAGCVAEAIAWIEANQAEAKPIISKYTGIPVESISDYHFTPGGQVRLEDVQAWLDWMVANEQVPDWVVATDVATNQYLEGN